MKGWVKLHRVFGKWEWADDPNMVSLFIHLLIAASNRDTKWRGNDIKRGQLFFGRKKWAEKTGISEQGIRTCLERLKSTGEITIKATNKYSIITVCNYDKYQSRKEDGQPANQPPDQPTINQQPTSNQPHREKVKKEEEEKKTERESDSVWDEDNF